LGLSTFDPNLGWNNPVFLVYIFCVHIFF